MKRIRAFCHFIRQDLFVMAAEKSAHAGVRQNSWIESGERRQWQESDRTLVGCGMRPLDALIEPSKALMSFRLPVLPRNREVFVQSGEECDTEYECEKDCA
jgi:hypothetical protein